jgi:hypothetical protein
VILESSTPRVRPSGSITSVARKPPSVRAAGTGVLGLALGLAAGGDVRSLRADPVGPVRALLTGALHVTQTPPGAIFDLTAGLARCARYILLIT